MKNMKSLAAAVALGLTTCALSQAQIQYRDPSQQGDPHHGADASSMTKHIAEVFAKVSAFDANKDGQLDATEKASLAKAIADGTLQLPAHSGPNGEKPAPEAIVDHIAEVYPQVAKLDVNHDGALDETEQAALKKAIEAGELMHPHSAVRHEADAASLSKHIAEVFAKVSAFDVNKDGQLDATEKASLAKAVADGTFQLPGHMGPQW
jgi:EF hand